MSRYAELSAFQHRERTTHMMVTRLAQLSGRTDMNDANAMTVRMQIADLTTSQDKGMRRVSVAKQVANTIKFAIRHQVEDCDATVY